MSVNRHQPHVLVLPEDDANRQLANGFLLDQSLLVRKIQVLVPAGGWIKVLESFEAEHIPEMERYPYRFMVLLIDFDGRQGRLRDAKSRIPANLQDRVFVIGSWTKPEQLKPELGSYEKIGLKAAKDCREETDYTWGHELLKHNSGEVDRLRSSVRSILFRE